MVHPVILGNHQLVILSYKYLSCGICVEGYSRFGVVVVVVGVVVVVVSLEGEIRAIGTQIIAMKTPIPSIMPIAIPYFLKFESSFQFEIIQSLAMPNCLPSFV